MIEHLIVSPAHNFVGHHGGPAGINPALEVDHAECIAGRGIRGDRYFDHKPDFKGQITFFDMATLEALRDELELPEAAPTCTRRNVFTRGLCLPELIGCTFELQGVVFEGTEECRPCYWMNTSFRDPRVEAWLAGRGGLRARIRTTGVLRLGV